MAVVVVDGMGNSTVKEHRRDVPFVASLEQHCAILRFKSYTLAPEP